MTDTKMAVRLAKDTDALAIARIQTRSFRERLVQVTGAPLSEETVALFNEDDFEHAWLHTLSNLNPEQFVFVAIKNDTVVGVTSALRTTPPLLADDVSTAESVSPGASHTISEDNSDATSSRLADNTDAIHAFELTSFDVPAAHLGEGHHARLLAAITDTIREAGGTELYIWALSGDDLTTRYLNEAGFTPRGFARGYDIDGQAITEQLWWTLLSPED